MKLTVIGCGDAFGSGGRLQSAYLLDHGRGRVLIDCGATVMVGLARFSVDPNSIEAIYITHLHGDHFAGLTWFLMHGAIVGRRSAPLAIYGPPSIASRVHALGEILYPGAATMTRAFSLTYHEMTERVGVERNGLMVTAFEVVHPSGAPSHALRCEADGKVFAFTGDSIWTQSIAEAGRAADLYLVDCYQFDRPSSVHLNWTTIAQHLDGIGARRTLLTHMSTEMLARRGEIDDPRIGFAEDGGVYDI